MFQLAVFQYNQLPVNTLIDSQTGEILFDASQVCDVLGYVRDASNVLQKLDDDEKRLVTKYDLNPTESVGLGNRGEKYFVTEAGLYKLIFRSEKGEAKEFTRWVAHEVLPAIRKTGKYAMYNDVDKARRDFEAAIDIAKLLRLEGNQAILAANRLMKKKFGDDYLALLEVNLESEVQERYLTVTDIGMKREPKVPPANVNKKLEVLGLQRSMRDGKGRIVWELTAKGKEYAKYMDTGKKHSDGTPVQQIKWLAKTADLL